jgi:hypothetical protein
VLGALSHKMEASHAFSQALQMHGMHGEAWLAWGKHNDEMAEGGSAPGAGGGGADPSQQSRVFCES